mgnify:CR=1 FL=1
MNLTPLIDVVFLLIIFFMLVSQIVTEQNVEMIVPAPTDPQTQELTEDDRPIMVNLAPVQYEDETRSAMPLRHSGQATKVVVGTREFGASQTSSITEYLGTLKASRIEQGVESVQAVVRADMAIHYEEVRPILEAIRAAEIEDVKLAAYTEEGPYEFD